MPSNKDEKTNATELKASEAAQKRADELGVDLASVEPTGSAGQVKVEDVEHAAEAAPPQERMIKVKVLVRAQYVTGPDGKNYVEGQPVTESYFDEVLKDARDSEGNRLYGKGGEA